MFCCDCGARNPDDANYCHRCGKAVCRDEADGERAFFLPREVYIRPNFHAIFDDLDLVKDTEEAWEQLGASIEKLPKSPFYRRFWGAVWDPYGGGFSFSFISPQVIYYPDAWNNFASEVRLSASLEPAGVRRELLRHEGEALFEVYSPWLNLRSGSDGYRLSIRIPESHWFTIRHKDVFKEIADKDVPRDALMGDLEAWSPAVEVPLAVVPYEEFEVHFTEGACPLRYQLPSSRRHPNEGLSGAIERRVKARARYGWKGEAMIDPDGTATTAEYSRLAEHRYCLVTYWLL
jgi:hypothetical protein